MKNIRTSKLSKIISCYLAIQLIITTVQPSNLFALTSGPSQPEFNSFTPIGTSDMVNLSSGDFNYNIPIMDVGGYPLNLAYNSGITMDQEASWVGLGWNLSVGQINRQVRGLPDDFNGDELIYENNLKQNKTIGATVTFHPAFAGKDFPKFPVGLDLNAGLGVNYNNYTGWSSSFSYGASYELSDNVTIGMNLTNSSNEGVSVSPKVSLNFSKLGTDKFNLGTNIGTTYNSRQGLTALSVSMLTKDKQTGKNTSNGAGFSASKSFSTTTYTPKKRNKLINQSIAANGAFGGEFFWLEGQLELYIHASKQKLALEEKLKTEKAFGFNFTEKATKYDILDFNRENDRLVTKNTNVLPVTNYTYDLYSIKGQGVSGMYQPYRSQVGYVYDKFVKDISKDGSLGIEIGAGNAAHVGVEFKNSPSSASTGLWKKRNNARSNFIQTNNNDPDYEKVFYKTIGELNVDNDYSLLEEQLGGDEPIKLQLAGSNYNKETRPNKYIKGTGELLSNTVAFENNTVNRKQRLLRNQAIQALTKKEVENYGSNDTHISSKAKDHHIVQTRILQPDGSTYVFGQPAYNTKKIEATFNSSGNSNFGDDTTQELVSYSGNDNTAYNSKGLDHYFNRITTPAYAHTYLLSEVLSSDYEDLTEDGPTADDLGAYTKIHYTQPENYNWRVPFQANTATSNKGLNTLKEDNMGNYIYGEKELLYVDKIETKTHVAVFNLIERNDGYGVTDENGGLSTNSKMYQINTISLYAKPEYDKLQANPNANVTPIKVAHFEYDYSLCKNVPNNNPNDNFTDPNESNFDGDLGGKLTLKSIYFTYRGSNMGKYTPYTFNYSSINPDYHIKGYNLWGNYKAPQGSATNPFAEPTTAEFPYVNQGGLNEENNNVTAWTLSSVNLPSGGKLEMSFEADDYGYVQDKEAMQMFKVRGVGINENKPDNFNDLLYNPIQKMRYLYVELSNETEEITATEFESKYIEGIKTDPIFFKFFLNMVKGQNYAYDFVSGYFKIDTEKVFGTFEKGGKQYGAIPVKLVHKNKESEGGQLNEHPIAKAGWYFGRNYLNRLVYGQSEVENFNVLDIAQTIVGSLSSMITVFNGPNTELKNKRCAQKFSTTKSWIRLKNPDKHKLGGGLRVSKIEMFDEWDTMTGHDGDNLYKMSYGQEYDYSNTDGTTSGVATYEPQGSKENPFVEPFYDDVNHDKLLAPQDQNFSEKPFGTSFFPSPKITYGRVSVKNLNRGSYTNQGTILEVGNNGTGKVVNEFYTSKDFPTIAKHTQLGDANVANFPGTGGSLLASMFGLNIVSKKRLSMSQGFVVITNDMDGKTKSQKVFSESADVNQLPISAVEYHYNVDDNGDLSNKVTTINDKGEIEDKVIGVDYNVINDFRHSKSTSETYGVDVNTAVVLFPIPLPPFLIPIVAGVPIPQLAFHDQELRTATTTKVIHKTSFLVEKKAFDLGAEVTTTNKAWDAETGQVILTETANEYKDKYYNFSYPAYWKHQTMGAATYNLNLELDINQGNDIGAYTATNANLYLVNGDEVWLKNNAKKAWITNVNGNDFNLIDREGLFIESTTNNEVLKIIRSGNRNLQSANMASVTSMKNPLLNTGNTLATHINGSTFDASDWDSKRIINASAVKYNNLWKPQCDCLVPYLSYDKYGELIFVHDDVTKTYNPYLYNILGDWRADESFAYLTGRYNDGDNPRNLGFFNDFSSFYKPDNSGNWNIDTTNWTSASTVTRYSPYGLELENKDALNRYSAAQYGYDKKLPVAVASNSEYSEMGFDNFEYAFNTRYCLTEDQANKESHFRFVSQYYTDEQNTSEEAHTGNKSVKLNPSGGSDASNIAILRKIINSTNENCTTFSPKANKRYAFSVWVKVNIPQTATTPQEILNAQPLSYENVKVSIHFNDSQTPHKEFYPQGDIIDGWQRIYGDFTIPNLTQTTLLDIKLVNESTTNSAYFDDARMHPYNASMKSFVYDEENYRLMSELDENNYATFYEYDNEGGLIRVKKETEKGIMTIQETRSGNVISNSN